MNKLKNFWNDLNTLGKTMVVILAICPVAALILTLGSAAANAQDRPSQSHLGHYETNKGSEDDRLSIYAECIKSDGTKITDLPALFTTAEDRAAHYGFAVIPLKGKTFEVDLAVGTVSDLGAFLKYVELDAEQVCKTI